MRLIDADEIVNTEFLYINNKTVIEFLKDVVGGWNTVDAIPIEWIWKWYDKETHRLGDGWTHVEHPYSIKRMIEDWEKEHEKDI